MELDQNLPVEISNLKETQIFTHGCLPIAAAYCRKLNLIERIDNIVESDMKLKPGIVVQTMILDTLSGRSPLYHIQDFMMQQDRELLLGTDINPSLFSDTNIARSLDSIFNAGPSKIITEIGIIATKEFSLNANVISYDTTSRNVWGEYKDCEQEQPPEGPLITYGYSKDNQPSLKQFMTELLCVEQGIPIFGKTLDGNSSDKKSNNTILTHVSTLMARHGFGPGAFTYVADSALVTESNLSVITIPFVTRLPATYTEHEKAVELAVNTNEWNDLKQLARTITNSNSERESAYYKVFETTVTLYEKKYRALVVHSSSHDKRRKRKLEKSIDNSLKNIEKKLKKLTTTFFCNVDAEKAAKEIEKITEKFHTITVTITPVETRKQGRPSKDKPTLMKTKYNLSWTIHENQSAIDKEKLLTGCFVLLSNAPITGENSLDSKQLLETYKGQYGVESDFAFLKDPLIVNDVFLKKPSRIEALGMILILSLMIWRLIERSMRVYLEHEKKVVEGWDKKKTTKPTTYMLFRLVFGIMVIYGNNKRWLIHSPTSRQYEFIKATGLTSDVFVDPNCRCNPKIPLNSNKNG